MSKPRGDLQLAIGYWIVSHKDKLRTWWAVSLLTVIAGSFIWTIVFFLIFFIQQVNLDKTIASSATALATYGQSAAVTPRSVEISEVTIIRRDATHVDLVAIATNSNKDWGVQSAMTEWQVAGAVITPETIFINPDATRPIMALNVTVTDPARVEATVGLNDIVWGRASAAPLPNPVFSTSGLALSRRTVQGPDGGTISTVNVRGEIQNQSVFNFFRVTVPILIKDGTQIIAVDQLTQTTWPTLTPKTINVTWPYPVIGATTIEALPQVSRFDSANLYR